MMRFSQGDPRERNSSVYQESSRSKAYLEPILRVVGSGLLAYVCWDGQGVEALNQVGISNRAMHLPFPGANKREKQYQVHPAFGDRRDGVISARTYFYASEAKCDNYMENLLQCIKASGGPLLGGALGCVGSTLAFWCRASAFS